MYLLLVRGVRYVQDGRRFFVYQGRCRFCLEDEDEGSYFLATGLDVRIVVGFSARRFRIFAGFAAAFRLILACAAYGRSSVRAAWYDDVDAGMFLSAVVMRLLDRGYFFVANDADDRWFARVT